MLQVPLSLPPQLQPIRIGDFSRIESTNFRRCRRLCMGGRFNTSRKESIARFPPLAFRRASFHRRRHRFQRQRASAPPICGFGRCPRKIGQGLPCRARVPHWQVSCIVASSASLGRVGVDGSCDPSGCRVAAGPHSCEAGRKCFGKRFPRPGGAGGVAAVAAWRSP